MSAICFVWKLESPPEKLFGRKCVSGGRGAQGEADIERYMEAEFRDK